MRRNVYRYPDRMSPRDWIIAIAMALPVSLLFGVGIVVKLFG